MISFRATKTGESYELFKIDTHATRVVRHVRLAGPVGPISFGNGALWMGRATPTVSVIRIDPRTSNDSAVSLATRMQNSFFGSNRWRWFGFVPLTICTSSETEIDVATGPEVPLFVITVMCALAGTL